MLDLGAGYLTALADGCVGADVAVAEQRTRTDDGGSAHGRALKARTSLDDHAPVHARVDQLPVDSLGQIVEDQAIGLQHVLQAPRVLPPALNYVRLHAQARVEQVLDGVGYLELPARRGNDRPRGGV